MNTILLPITSCNKCNHYNSLFSSALENRYFVVHLCMFKRVIISDSDLEPDIDNKSVPIPDWCPLLEGKDN